MSEARQTAGVDGLHMRLVGAKERLIGGTDAAAVMGVSRWSTPLDVYNRLVHGTKKPVNKAMLRGIKAEPAIRAAYLAEHPCQVLQWVTKPVIFAHPVHAFITVSPDDVRADGILVEYKSSNRWSKMWRDGPPADYTMQVMHGLAVLDLQVAHLYVAHGEDSGDDFVIHSTSLYEFKRDAELEADMLAAEVAFWRNYVEPRIPPPASEVAA